MVCSLLDAEGAELFDRFSASYPQFRADPPEMSAGRARGAGVRLTPYHDGTDGFFFTRAALV